MQFFSGRYSKAIIKKIQPLFRGGLAIFLALIISITDVIIPDLNLIGDRTADAATQSPIETGLNIFRKAEGLFTYAKSFLPDITIFGSLINGNPALLNLNQNFQLLSTLASTLVPTLALSPGLSLVNRVDFFFNIKEVNFIKQVINDNGSSMTNSLALENYRLGIEKSQQKDYKNAIKHYTDALIKDGDFAEAYLSRGRAYSELGHLDLTIADYNRAMQVKARFTMEIISDQASLPKRLSERTNH